MGFHQPDGNVKGCIEKLPYKRVTQLALNRSTNARYQKTLQNAITNLNDWPGSGRTVSF